MDRPGLVVDAGTYGTSVALVGGGRVGLVPCPDSGAARWPSCAALDGEEFTVGAAAQRRRGGQYFDAVRAVVDAGDDGRALLARYLAAVRAEADRQAGGPVDRLTLVVPAGYGATDPRRAEMRAAAADCGFPDAELVSDAVAAVEDVRARADLPDGALVLVCDLGLLWTVTLVRVAGGRTAVLGTDATAGFDRLIAADVLATTGPDGDPHIALDVARRVKHHLSDADEATGWVAPDAPPYQLTRAGLERFAEPALRWLLASARAIVARAGFGLPDLTAVALVGGGSRMPAVAPVLREHLGRPVVHPEEPELAVIRGAAAWAARGRAWPVVATAPAWHLEPVVWDPPPGAALARWLVAEGDGFRAGDVLARVWVDEHLVDLTAGRDGIMVEHRVGPGGAVRGDAVAAVARPARPVAGDPQPRHRLRATGGFALTPDRRLVAAWPDGGAAVTLRAVESGEVVAEARPAVDGDVRGRVYVGPGGRLALVTWDAAGEFAVWDLPGGEPVAKFGAGARPLRVRVDERTWRLAAEVDRAVRVGRYRHAVAVVWDLATGEAVEEEASPDPLRRYRTFAERSSRDGFGPTATAGDGLEARVVRIDGDLAVTVTRDGRKTVHCRQSGVDDLRVAFGADARHLLVTWTSGDGASQLEVWRL